MQLVIVLEAIISVGLVVVSAFGGHTPPDKGSEREQTQREFVHDEPFGLSGKSVSFSLQETL